VALTVGLVRIAQGVRRRHARSVLVPCTIDRSGDFVRCVIGPGTDEAIQECYRSLAVMCIESGVTKAIVLGAAGDPAAHRALVAGLRCAALAGLPTEFKLALVANATALQQIFAQAQEEAGRAGIETRLFHEEGKALGWLGRH
jgi:hypothetical protein